MSDKDWYEGLTGKELSGKHVHVVFKTGTVVDGRLEWDGHIRVSPTWRVGVLYPGNGGAWELSPWEPFPGIESVSLVWDERDWEQISLKDADEGDSLVISGDLYSINEARFVDDPSMPIWWSVEEDSYIVPPDMVSCALRRKAKLPTELGAYRGADGTLLILTDISLPNKWVYVSEDYKGCGVFLGDEQAEEYLPLSPVHFVDGRAE